jgi:integrase
VKPTARAHVGWLAAWRRTADVTLHRKHVNMADRRVTCTRTQDTAETLYIHHVSLLARLCLRIRHHEEAPGCYTRQGKNPMKLNRAAIDKLPPPPNGKREYVAWDSDLPGLGVRVRKTSKVWRIQYRVGRQQRSESLGDIRRISLESARGIARKRFAEVELGVDPGLARKAAAAKIALGAVVEKYLQAKQRVLRASTYAGAVRYFAVHWGTLRDRPLDEIKRADIAMRLQELVELHGPSAAARARSHLGACFSWAMREGLCEANPCISTNNPEQAAPRERVLSDRELATIWKACADDSSFSCIIRLLALTGCRRDEIGALRWAEVDFSTGVLTLPPERTKNGRALVLPLPTPAVDILHAVPRRDGHAHLFGREGFTSWSVATKQLHARIAAAGASLEPWRVHDLRRTMRTGLGRIGVRPDVAEMCINHVRSGMIAVYDRYRYKPEIADALARWSEHLMAVIEGRESKVVPLRA